jgi:UDP-4-amino-4,6-dideoxy-N-acetyl-beta-L-altrosamine N-acetyltransferase
MINNQIKFKEIKISDAKKILKWRRQPRVTNYQFSDIKDSLKLQKKWISESYNKPNYYHWIILYKKIPIGFFSINNINLKKLETTWAWYIGPEKYLALGGFIPPFFYNWVFLKFKIKKINAYVFANNSNVIKIHKFHGYKTLKKIYVSKKNNKKIKYIKMVLFKNKWNFNKYKKYVTEFPTLKWKKINEKNY